MFVVKVQSGSDIADIQCDGNGQFRHMGTYSWLFDADSIIVKGKHRRGKQPKDPSQFLVTKTYYAHKGTPEFKKVIIHGTNTFNDIFNNVVIVIYRFDHERKPLIILPHGNSKTGSSYTRVKPSLVKKLASADLPRRALAQHICDHGGVGTIGRELLPRPAQVTRQAPHPHDTSRRPVDWEYLMDLAHRNDTVVRSVSEFPEPCFILATEQQLIDMVRFGTGENAQPITVDPTFNLGPFFVTPITIRNVLLQSKRTGASAAFCGPILVHYNKTKAAYLQLFLSLKALCPGLDALRAVGTDGEDNLVQAFQQIFPAAIHLRCYRHFEGNLLMQVRKHGLSGSTQEMIEQLGLLVNCKEEDMQSVMMRATDTWRAKKNGDKVAAYLHDRIEIIRQHLHVDVLRRAGAPADKFYTNASESINHKIKGFVGGRPQNLTTFIRLMGTFLGAEQQAAEMAYYGRSDDYDIAVSQRAKFTRLDAGKQQYLATCNAMPIECQHRKQHEYDFDINADEAQLVVHRDIVEAMYSKAAQLLTEPRWVCLAPPTGSSDLAYCAKSSSGTRFHQVIVRQNTKEVKCDCPSWRTNKVCSHSIAVAQQDGCLVQYMAWHRMNRKPDKYSALVQGVNMDKAGLKPNQQKRIRKHKTQDHLPQVCSPAPNTPHDSITVRICCGSCSTLSFSHCHHRSFETEVSFKTVYLVIVHYTHQYYHNY